MTEKLKVHPLYKCVSVADVKKEAQILSDATKLQEKFWPNLHNRNNNNSTSSNNNTQPADEEEELRRAGMPLCDSIICLVVVGCVLWCDVRLFMIVYNRGKNASDVASEVDRIGRFFRGIIDHAAHSRWFQVRHGEYCLTGLSYVFSHLLSSYSLSISLSLSLFLNLGLTCFR